MGMWWVDANVGYADVKRASGGVKCAIYISRDVALGTLKSA